MQKRGLLFGPGLLHPGHLAVEEIQGLGGEEEQLGGFVDHQVHGSTLKGDLPNPQNPISAGADCCLAVD